MKKLLHIIATPRTDESRTLKVSESFLTGFHQKYPDCEVDELNLFAECLPGINMKMIEAKYMLMTCQGEMCRVVKDSWSDVTTHIKRFLQADAYLISSPMWNFSIPYVLKHYIDVIVQPQYLFQYTNDGVEGLVKNKKMVVVTSRGSDYGDSSPMKLYDHQQDYLKTIFGFVGITDLQFINAQPMDSMTEEVRTQKIQDAQKCALEMVQEF